jgi:glucokinase
VLLDAVRGVLARWTTASPFLASLDLEERVQLVPRGFPPAAVGAALVGETLIGETLGEGDSLVKEVH